MNYSLIFSREQWLLEHALLFRLYKYCLLGDTAVQTLVMCLTQPKHAAEYEF